jgi:hypothetical protein
MMASRLHANGSQHLHSVYFREVQIEEHECRARGFLVLYDSRKIEERVMPIVGDAQFQIESATS